MNKYELIGTLVVLITCLVKISQAGGHHFDLLDFWVRDAYKTSPNLDYRRNANRRTLAPEVSKALDNAKSAMQMFFKDLSSYNTNKRLQPAIRRLQKLNEKLGQSMESDSEQIQDYRKHVVGHSHGPHHRWKPVNAISPEPQTKTTTPTNTKEKKTSPPPKMSEITVQPTLIASLPVKKSLRAPMHLAQETAPPTAEADTETTTPEEKEITTHSTSTTETTAYVPVTGDGKHHLSPYSLYQELENYVLPLFSALNITLEVIGRTVEYNDLILMKVTQPLAKVFRSGDMKFDDITQEKKVIFIVHGLSVMGFNELPCMRSVRSIEDLLAFYFKHLDQFDIYLIPMANPDGVAAASMKPFWNKNMSPQEACPGVALDRNFDVAWNESYASTSSCGQHFPGRAPFSEPETQAVRDVLHKYSHKIVGYFHVHASTYATDIFKGDAILYPKGYTDSTTDDDKYIDLKGEIEEMMRNASFKVLSVTVDTLYNWYGKVFGSSVDYACTIYGIPFCMELVMQLYDDDMMVDNSEERETSSALHEIWGRVIDVIFDFIHRTMSKALENNDMKR